MSFNGHVKAGSNGWGFRLDVLIMAEMMRIILKRLMIFHRMGHDFQDYLVKLEH